MGVRIIRILNAYIDDMHDPVQVSVDVGLVEGENAVGC